MNRRGFIRGLIAAPFAGKEAISKLAQIGIQGTALGGATSESGVGYSEPRGFSSHEDYSWCHEGLKRLLDPDNIKRIRDECFVAHLDPDLAACNSFSLAVRYTMQRERLVERQINSQRSRFETILREAGLL